MRAPGYTSSVQCTSKTCFSIMLCGLQQRWRRAHRAAGCDARYEMASGSDAILSASASGISRPNSSSSAIVSCAAAGRIEGASAGISEARERTWPLPHTEAPVQGLRQCRVPISLKSSRREPANTRLTKAQRPAAGTSCFCSSQAPDDGASHALLRAHGPAASRGNSLLRPLPALGASAAGAPPAAERSARHPFPLFRVALFSPTPRTLLRCRRRCLLGAAHLHRVQRVQSQVVGEVRLRRHLPRRGKRERAERRSVSAQQGTRARARTHARTRCRWSRRACAPRGLSNARAGPGIPWPDRSCQRP